jgi:hypothetical protein
MKTLDFYLIQTIFLLFFQSVYKLWVVLFKKKLFYHSHMLRLIPC